MSFVVSGLFVVCLLAVVSTVFKDIGIDVLFNLDAFFIVIGGTVTALFIGFPVKRIKATVRDVVNTFQGGSSRKDIVKEIVEIARIQRKFDLKKLENRSVLTEDPFLRLGVNLLLNRYNNEEIRNIMERELAIRIANLNLSQNVIMTMARLAPSFGLAGTVIGLIKIFKHFQSFETVVPVMATALMSTFYGVVIANLILLPLSSKIKERVILCEEMMQTMIEGIIAINNGEYPLRIEERLLGYSDETSTADAINSVHALRTAKG